MNFTFTGTNPHTFTAAPVRADGTPGTIPVALRWTLTPSALATLAPGVNFSGDSNLQCAVTPAVGANGTAVLSVAGKDENGSAVSSTFNLTFSNVANPTVGYTLTLL